MSMHSTLELFDLRVSFAIPALPGAHHIFVGRGDCASFQTKVCSRPPPPITKIFIYIRGFIVDQS